jgi:hypothetical protein
VYAQYGTNPPCFDEMPNKFVKNQNLLTKIDIIFAKFWINHTFFVEAICTNALDTTWGVRGARCMRNMRQTRHVLMKCQTDL